MVCVAKRVSFAGWATIDGGACVMATVAVVDGGLVWLSGTKPIVWTVWVEVSECDPIASVTANDQTPDPSAPPDAICAAPSKSDTAVWARAVPVTVTLVLVVDVPVIGLVIVGDSR